jgi:hypothetical protein
LQPSLAQAIRLIESKARGFARKRGVQKRSTKFSISAAKPPKSNNGAVRVVRAWFQKKT